MNAVLYDWPFVGLAAGLLGVAALIAWPRPKGSPSRWRDPSWLVCLMLPVYMVHQFEEHGFNLLGERYHFIDEMCAALGHPTVAGCPASPAFIFAVNCGGGVWIPGLLAIAYRYSNVMVGACGLGIPLVNAIVHIGQGVVHGHYNSGLLTAAVLFIPMCLWSLLQFRRAGLLGGGRIAAVLASGVLVHVVLISSLLARGHGLIGEGALLVVNVLDGLIPLGLATLVGRRSIGGATQDG